MQRTFAFLLLTTMILVAPIFGANPDDEAWLPSAGHGPGAAGSFWVTDLYLTNPTEDALEVIVTFLPLASDNTDAEGETFEIGAGELLVLEDVVAQLTSEQSAFGALHIEVFEEDDEDGDALIWIRRENDAEDYFEDEAHLMVYSRIYDRGGEGTRGQALEGFTSQAAIAAESGAPSTHVIGVSNNADYRTNWFGINVSEDDDENPVDATVLIELLDSTGDPVGSTMRQILPRSPIFGSLTELGTIEDGSLRFTMIEGAGIFGASRVDNVSNDAATLEPFWMSFDPDDRTYTDSFNIESCTWTTMGENSYFPLRPGLRLVLEAEEEGEVEQVVIEVTGQTKMVDGVITRALVETESVDGELTEISTNYFAECVETGDVYYFGEDVDIYEEGEIVSHDGAWLAGENGNRPGIIMPGGTPLVGSRYYQEVAPEIALDRGEHVAVGQTIETEAGVFENCLIVLDTNALEPAERGDPKAYCPGLGLVRDEDLELVEMNVP